MRILGIETSCDETAISLIEADGDYAADFHFRILGDMTLSQAKLHAEFGGVYPNLAKREHAKNFTPILAKVLDEAKLPASTPTPLTNTQSEKLKELLTREPELYEQLSKFFAEHGKPEIDAISVTAGPGLEPALWVGINAARALSYIWNIPVVAANHMEGHIFISLVRSEEGSRDQVVSKASFLRSLGKELASLFFSLTRLKVGSSKRSSPADSYSLFPITFPAVALLISGGHTELILMSDWMEYQKIGETRDDAVGEAFDKTARLLGLPYPGGPELSRIAEEARESGRPDIYKFPRPMIGTDDLDFSFSGLKTAVRVAIEGKTLSDDDKAGVARAFEDAVLDVIEHKVQGALAKHNAKAFIMGGGVSANRPLRERLTQLVANEFPDTTLLVSTPERATDNALMIALAGYFHAARHDYTELNSIIAEGTRQLA